MEFNKKIQKLKTDLVSVFKNVKFHGAIDLFLCH